MIIHTSYYFINDKFTLLSLTSLSSFTQAALCSRGPERHPAAVAANAAAPVPLVFVLVLLD